MGQRPGEFGMWRGAVNAPPVKIITFSREKTSFSSLDGLEFKPHLGGHWDKAHYSRGVLHGARALTSNRMLPHCGFEGLCTLGLRQQRNSTTLRAHAVHTEEVPV